MEPTPNIEVLVDTAVELMRDRNRFAAIELLAPHEPAVVIGVYKKLQTELYWTRKDLAAAVAASHAGIQHALTSAATSDDPAGLRGSAKTLAYNLASFTWPGWDEPGIEIAPSNLAIGLEAARLNCRLADELDRPDEAKANGLWMLAAHHLAAGDAPLAAATFRRGRSLADSAGKGVLGLMLAAWTVFADREGDAQLDRAVDALRAEGSDDANAYADQIAVARRVFGQR